MLALAQSLTDVLVLLDDEAARKEARRLGLSVRGTLGVIVDAYLNKLLTFEQTDILLQEIGRRTDIWISAKLCQQIRASIAP